MFKIGRRPRLVVRLLGYCSILLIIPGSVAPAWGQGAPRIIPSLGGGSYEVTLFTDYFCRPCRMIDTKAETLIKELLATKQVRVTFVDVPFTRISPVYAKYYLYAVNANANAPHVLHIRKMLFDAAQDKRIQKEDVLVAYLQENKISWRAFDEKSVFPLLSAAIKEHKINATPTCLIKHAAGDTKKYVGNDEIWAGLTALKGHLKTATP